MKNFINNYKFTIFYILTITLINIGFIYVPLIPFYDTMYPPMSIIVGIIFILRDFAQKEIGHKVFIAMFIGAFLSYIMANPYIAFASMSAFIISESIDWAVYTFTKKPLHQRIFLSSLLSTPIDSAVFLLIIGNFSVLATITMFVSKMLACIAIWYFFRKKDETHI